MKTDRILGIWMDHSIANLIDMKDSTTNPTIESNFTHDKKVSAMHTGENHMHNKEQQLQESYYKEIAEEILKYDHVLLFGPTNAKVELNNYLYKDLHFKDIKIDVKSADNMTDSEKDAFVRKHFENQ